MERVLAGIGEEGPGAGVGGGGGEEEGRSGEEEENLRGGSHCLLLLLLFICGIQFKRGEFILVEAKINFCCSRFSRELTVGGR